MHDRISKLTFSGYKNRKTYLEPYLEVESGTRMASGME
jgi:hypothetical protein